MFKYHFDMGHCFSKVVVVSKKVKIYIYIFFYFFLETTTTFFNKTDMVLGKKWLFSIWNVEKGRKSPVNTSVEGNPSQPQSCLCLARATSRN